MHLNLFEDKGTKMHTVNLLHISQGRHFRVWKCIHHLHDLRQFVAIQAMYKAKGTQLKAFGTAAPSSDTWLTTAHSLTPSC
jgi:hypothetical protein